MTGFSHRENRLRSLLAALTVAVVTATGVGTVQAQSSDLQSLIQRVERLQRDIVTLQRQVYAGAEIPAPASELENVQSGGGDISPRVAARMQTRLDELEAQLRSLTGQIEQANFQARQVATQLERMNGDFDYRLQQLERRAIGGPGPSGDNLSAVPGATGAPAALGASPGAPQVLGQVPQADVDALRAQQQAQGAAAEAPSGAAPGPAPAGNQQTAALPGGSVQADYDHAFGLLRQANYGEAESALKTFLETHPEDPLAGNAKYWLGETFYVRGDFRNAAVTFAEGFQLYPDSTKAADNLLKLGMSLAQLDKKGDACGAFSELLKRYPDATQSILQRASRERERLGC